MRSPPLLVFLCGLTGCLFDAAVPAGTPVACAVDADCPGGDVCVVGRCAPVEALRAETPTAADVNIAPAVVGRGGTVVVTFTVEAPLGAPPLVELDAGRLVPLDLVSGGPGQPWRFQRVLDGSEAPGTAAVTVTLVDGLGRSSTSPLGDVVVDLVPPVFSEAAPITALARAGSAIGVDALLNEAADVRAEAILGDGTALPLDVTLEGLRVRARGVVDGRFSSGPVALRLAARDEGGNDSGVVDAGVVVIDLEAPTVTLQPPPASVRPGDLVRFIATATEVVTAPPLVVDGVSLVADVEEGTALSWSWIAPTGDRVVAATPGTFTDLAGNAVDVSPLTVEIDGTPPGLVVEVAPPDQARAGEQVTATFSFDEDVTAVVVEAQRFDDVVVIPVVDDGGVWRIDIGTDRFASEGRYDLIVTARDAVGNESRALLGGVVVDARPPSLISAAFTPAAGRLGSIVTLQLTFSEPLRVVDNVVDLEVTTNTTGLTFVGVAGNTVTYTLVVDDGTPGLVDVTRLEAIDLAGNLGVIEAAGTATLVVDNVAPVLSEVAPAARRVARRAGQSIVVTGVAVDPDGVAPPTIVAGFATRQTPCVFTGAERFTCDVPVLGTDEDGPQTVEIGARDVAGNVTSETVIVTLDGEGPQLVSATFSAAKARPASTVQLAVVTDERMAAVELGLSTGTIDLAPGAASVVQALAMPTVDLKLNTLRLTDDLGNLREVVLAQSPLVVADGLPPEIVGSVVTTNRIPLAGRVGDAVVVDLDVTLPLIEAPTINFGAAPMAIIADDGAGHVTARRILDGTETEGATPITVTAVDDVGNVGFAALATPVVVDFTPPAVVAGSAQVSIKPPFGSPVLGPKAVGIAGAASVSFQVVERLFGLPTIQVNGANVIVTALSADSSGVSFLIGASSLVNGSQQVQAVLEDQVGNVGQALITALDADLVAPPPLTPQELGLFTHVRAPHGSIGNAEAFHEVRGRAPLTTRDRHTVTVALDAQETLRVATATITAATPVIPLDRDFDSVFLQIYDEAGNRAAGLARRPRTEFVAGLHGKVAGSQTSNPHRIELRRHFTTVPVDASAEEIDGDAVAGLDGNFLFVEPEGRWQESGPQPPPTARTRVASTTHDGTVFLFGGCTTGELPSDEAYFFDGRGWKAFVGQEGPQPPARCGAGLVSDGARLHLVGGEGTTGLLDDHWVWDGLNWKIAEQPTGLPASDMALGYDPRSDELVFYGGFTGAGVSGQLRRAPIGGDWQPVATGPAVAAAAVASVDGQMLVIGGVNGRAEPVSSVVTIDGGVVTAVDDALPAPRARACALPRGVDVLVLGGVDDRAATASALLVRPGQTTSAPELDLPDARFSAGCGRIGEEPLIFGGTGGGAEVFDDTLRFSIAWAPIEGAADLPSARGHAAVAPLGEFTYAFGGETATGASDEVWELDEVWKPIGTIKAAVERAAAACRGEECFIVGGLDGLGNRTTTGQLWRRIDRTTVTVQHVGLTPRTGPAMAVRGDGLILFGGQTDVSTSGETCITDKAIDGGSGPELTWACSILPGPPASAGAVMVNVKGEVYLYAAGQVWRFKDTLWEASLAEVRPPTRQAPGLAVDPDGNTLWLHGGVVGATRFDDLWSYDVDGDSWRQHAPADPFGTGAPEGRSAHVLRFDTRLRRLVVFGGDAPAGRFGDMWDFLPPEQARAGVVITVDTSSLLDFATVFVQAFGASLTLPGPTEPFGDNPTTTLPLLVEGPFEVPIVGSGTFILNAVDIRVIRP